MIDILHSIGLVFQITSGATLGNWVYNNLWRVRKCSKCKKLMKMGTHCSYAKNGKSKYWHIGCFDLSKKLEDQI